MYDVQVGREGEAGGLIVRGHMTKGAPLSADGLYIAGSLCPQVLFPLRILRDHCIAVDAAGAGGHRLHAGPVRGQAGRGGRGPEAGEPQVQEEVAALQFPPRRLQDRLCRPQHSSWRMHHQARDATISGD